MSILPVAESSGPSSGSQSSAETDDLITGSSATDDTSRQQQLTKRKKKKRKSTPPGRNGFRAPVKTNYLVAGLFSEFYKTMSGGNGENRCQCYKNSKKLL